MSLDQVNERARVDGSDSFQVYRPIPSLVFNTLTKNQKCYYYSTQRSANLLQAFVALSDDSCPHSPISFLIHFNTDFFF
jgi:hypothetical protein